MTQDILARPFTHASFQAFLDEGRLMGSQCTECGQIYLPPRAICPDDLSDHMAWVALAGTGTLAAFTVVHIAPTKMVEQGYGRENPYCTGIVELEEGVKISAMILGVDVHAPETIKIGTPLTVEFVPQDNGEETHNLLAFRVVE